MRLALTAVRAPVYGRSGCARRLERHEPRPLGPQEAEIKVAAVGTPKVADADGPQHFVGQIIAFFWLMALLVTGWTGRHWRLDGATFSVTPGKVACLP